VVVVERVAVEAERVEVIREERETASCGERIPPRVMRSRLEDTGISGPKA
jgi:hypothetical protein